MKRLYKGNQCKTVHSYAEREHIADGWSYVPENDHVQKTTEKGHSLRQGQEEVQEVKLNKTQKQALELGLEITDKDGKYIHHKKLAMQIKEALHGDDNEG